MMGYHAIWLLALFTLPGHRAPRAFELPATFYYLTYFAHMLTARYLS